MLFKTLSKEILQGTAKGTGKRGIKNWTSLSFLSSQRAIEDGSKWRKNNLKCTSGAQMNDKVKGLK